MVDVRVSYEESEITAIGEAEIVSGDEAVPIVRRLHRKYLTDEALQDDLVGPAFVAMDDVAIRLKPLRWISWDMAGMDFQALGGALAENRYLNDIVP